MDNYSTIGSADPCLLGYSIVGSPTMEVGSRWTMRIDSVWCYGRLQFDILHPVIISEGIATDMVAYPWFLDVERFDLASYLIYRLAQQANTS